MIYEPLFKLEKTGVQMKFYTNQGKYNAAHWHGAIELIYVLNGTGTVTIEGVSHSIVTGEFVVIDSNCVHEVKCTQAVMMVVIHYSRSSMKNFIEELDQLHFFCTKDRMEKEQLDAYLQICNMLKELPPLYVRQPAGYKLKTHAVAMSVFYELVHHFSETADPGGRVERKNELERMGEIITYIEQNHAEPITLEQIASHFYLSREYFSRFFKKQMGVTFSRYVNQVRLMRIYQDICNTQDGILELAEQHGFTNYKLFNKMFREIYGCTPRELRRNLRAGGSHVVR